MRFVEAGPDIPTDLVVAQERGETLFVCGAGVSRTVGLPLFRELVAGVYRRLGEDWTHHPAEREAMNFGGELFGQYDRVLRCLERRLAASETHRKRSMRARIRAAIRDELAPPEGADLSTHFVLCKLSRDSQGQSRLLTTNFDTLFERAWLDATGEVAASYAGIALPRPMSMEFHGILHLHGRLADPSVRAVETELVLTSAEFGDAYLRSGWASRYVYDLARTHTLVLVGYQADDPPMRYLLEALEADREFYVDLKKVYAFGECSADNREIREALWRAKGVEPVLYQLDNNNSHEPLYQSLREWKAYAEDPTAWRREHLRALLKSNPLPSSEEQINRCLALLDRGDAGQILGELSPDASWLPVIVQRGLFKQSLPGTWIANRVDDSEMIRACSALTPIDDETRWRVEQALTRDDQRISAVRERAWRLLLSVRPLVPNSMFGDWYSWKPSIRRGRADSQARGVVAGILTPRLEVSRPLWWPDDDAGAPEGLQKLVNIAMEPRDHPTPAEILQAWPDTIVDGQALFRTLDRALTDALEQASDLGLIGDWDHPSGDVPSVAEHPQNVQRGGFRPIVRAIADLWQRIARRSPDQARLLISHWKESPFLLLKRMYIFALADEAWPANDAARAVCEMADSDFWNDHAQVEQMRLLAGRWAEFGDAERIALERRICEGVPATLFSDDAPEDNDQVRSVVDSSIYRRLSRINSNGGVLSTTSQARLAEISANHSNWTAEPGDRDDFSRWYESRIGPQGDSDLLAGVADERLVQEAFRLQQERQYDEGDLWRVFCNADPDRALRGLRLESEAGRWDPDAWRYLLWAASEKGDITFQHALADLVLAMPAAALAETLHAATSWLLRRRKALTQARELGRSHFLVLWDRMAELAYDQQEDVEAGGFEGRLIDEALNRPGGDLASALLSALASIKPADGEGLGHDLGPRFQRLGQARGRAGLLSRVYITRELAYMDTIDPAWTRENLVPRLDWTHEESLPLWQAYASGRVGSAHLFNGIKAFMLQAFERKSLSAEHLEGVFQKLMTVAVRHKMGTFSEYVLTTGELKRALTISPVEVREYAAWQLWQLMKDEGAGDKAARWRDLVKPLFLEIWPLDAKTRDKGVSERLVLMTLECNDAISDAVDTILDFIVPYRLHGLSSSLRLEDHHEELFQEHPGTFLKLASALIDADAFPVPQDLPEFLQECIDLKPALKNDRDYIRLYGIRRKQNA